MNVEGNKIRAEEIAGIFQEVCRKRPLIHMLPNAVSASLCADGLSALGARPLMAVEACEMEEITRQADASVINLGQPDSEKLRAAELVIKEAAGNAKPLVLDPVGCGASHFRLESVQRILNMPWQGIVKGNRSELYSIQNDCLTMEGVDAIANWELSERIPADRVYLATGKDDLILWAGNSMEIAHREGRSPEKTSRYNIVGSGCLTGAVAGACYAAVLRTHSGLEKISDERILTRLRVTAALAASLGMAFGLERANAVSGYGMAKAALLDGLTLLAEPEFEDWIRKGERRWME